MYPGGDGNGSGSAEESIVDVGEAPEEGLDSDGDDDETRLAAVAADAADAADATDASGPDDPDARGVASVASTAS